VASSPACCAIRSNHLPVIIQVLHPITYTSNFFSAALPSFLIQCHLVLSTARSCCSGEQYYNEVLITSATVTTSRGFLIVSSHQLYKFCSKPCHREVNIFRANQTLVSVKVYRRGNIIRTNASPRLRSLTIGQSFVLNYYC
jgi:hypothetical protein